MATRASWAAGASVVVCIAIATATWGKALAAQNETTTRQSLCQNYSAFTGAILNSGPLADAGVRMSAARLQQSAERFPAAPLPASRPAHDAAPALGLLLNAPYATRKDLFIAARPVAVECGLDWRNGSSWEYAPGS